MAEINAGRAQLYREAAAKNGVYRRGGRRRGLPERGAGQLKPGEYYKPADGGWVRK